MVHARTPYPYPGVGCCFLVEGLILCIIIVIIWLNADVGIWAGVVCVVESVEATTAVPDPC